MAEKTADTEFSKQTAISLIRDFFPLSGEISDSIYDAWELNKVDSEIVRGIPDWDFKTPTTSRPTAATAPRSSPFGIIEQIKRRRDY
jgi:hypothetical protein